MRTQIGAANYSYVFVEDALVRLLNREGYTTRYVMQPEVFKTNLAYEHLLQTTPEQVIHIAFRSTENIRPMHGAKNICHFAWEFEVMNDRGLATGSILHNQIHMLNLMDEVWVGCRFTQDVLARYGITRTHIVPAPIIESGLPQRLPFDRAFAELAAVPCIPLIYGGAFSRAENMSAAAARIAPLSDLAFFQRKMNGEAGHIFLSVLAPGDLRKNLLNIIEGFQLAAARWSDAILIIKFAVSNKGDYLTGILYDYLSPLCYHQMSHDDDRIAFISYFLSDSEMSALFSLADFYVSASHCEGYNLPLLQAMSYGVVPVSTRNTAMLDYIDADNAVVIDEKRVTSPIEGMAADVTNSTYEIGFASRFDIARAMSNATQKNQEEIDTLSDAARGTILTRYGAEAVSSIIASRLDHHIVSASLA